jgi:formate dehydrogenase subunit gamma
MKNNRFPRFVVLPLWIAMLTWAVPLGWAHQGGQEGHAHAVPDNPRSAFWRQAREGVVGYTAVKGQETGVLIQSAGQNWRQVRNGPLAAAGGGLLGVTVFALGAFYLWRGQVPLSHPRTGRTVVRWSLGERVLHWYTAVLFLWLTLTGLSLLYGRALLIPLIGHEAFSSWAALSKLTHNFTGPLFIAGLLLMMVAWARHNLPNRLDLEWFKSFGGMVGDTHPSAERMNAGEKAWFWLLAFGGVLLSTSGLVLDFPNFGQERWAMQIAHLLHVVFALVLIAGSLGHIYIGSIGTEGALEGMLTGKVDTAWARQHHDLWYAELTRGQRETNLPESVPSSSTQGSH